MYEKLYFLGETVLEKMAALWMPVTLFLIIKAEHAITNFFYIPNGMAMSSGLSFLDFVWKNLVPVILGNIVGPAILVSGLYWLSYVAIPSEDNKRRFKEPANECYAEEMSGGASNGAAAKL